MPDPVTREDPGRDELKIICASKPEVGTALSNPYLSFAEALNGLAGPQ